MRTLVEVREELQAKRNQLSEFFKSREVNVNGEITYKMGADEISEARKRNEELSELSKEFEGLREVTEIASRNAALAAEQADGKNRLPQPSDAALDEAIAGRRPVVSKTLGQMFIESASYKGRQPGQKSVYADIENYYFKSTMGTHDVALGTPTEVLTGYPVETARNGRIEFIPTRRPVIADLIPQDPTTGHAIKYMEEITFLNAAAPVAEGQSKPEAALQYVERTIPIEKIAVYIPVTDEQLADEPQIRGIIDNRLTTMVLLAEENQLLNGNGTSPQLMGFLNAVGVQSYVKPAGQNIPDAVYNAMTLVRYTGFADVTGLVVHPNDWMKVRLLKTAQGAYIWGPPTEVGPERMWGQVVVATTAMTEGKALLGDFQMYSHISRRMGIQLAVSDSHADYFVRNLLAIRAEERLSLELYRKSAFCIVSDLNVP